MTDNRTTELLPCPFCGGENVDTSYKDTFSGDFRRGVYCADCCGGIYPYYDTEAEAIAAWNIRATYGTLTAEQVREAIFHGSVYASYDGAQYYANGINMQAIADELNARAERTCHNTHENRWFKCSACGYGFTDLYAEDEGDIDEQPRYCPNCGARRVDA